MPITPPYKQPTLVFFSTYPLSRFPKNFSLPGSLSQGGRIFFMEKKLYNFFWRLICPGMKKKSNQREKKANIAKFVEQKVNGLTFRNARCATNIFAIPASIFMEEKFFVPTFVLRNFSGVLTKRTNRVFILQNLDKTTKKQYCISTVGAFRSRRGCAEGGCVPSSAFS